MKAANRRTLGGAVSLVIFMFVAAGASGQDQRFQVLYTFAGGTDGAFPNGPLVHDGAGDFYGTCMGGGAYGRGVVFELTPSGQEIVLSSFDGDNGAEPVAGLAIDNQGNLYGTTSTGGDSPAAGVVFKIGLDGSETVLHNFKLATGAKPYSGVVLDDLGNLYGTTFYGGASGYGVVFKLTPSGVYNVLHSFSGGADGAYPFGGLARDSGGNLYGTTEYGGSGGSGVVFRMDASGKETVLYSFPSSGTQGKEPLGQLLPYAGYLYGTANAGGESEGGVAFKLSLTAGYSVLYNFNRAISGFGPEAGLTTDDAGNLYGTTVGGPGYLQGVVFKLDQTGRYTTLYAFDGGPSGTSPNAGLLWYDGSLYGTNPGSYSGNGGGVIFKITP